MDNGLIFPYPYGIVQAESAMLSFLPMPSGGGGSRPERVVGEPVERRKRLAVPGGGCPGVRA
jgi:hypothetical protein